MVRHSCVLSLLYLALSPGGCSSPPPRPFEWVGGDAAVDEAYRLSKVILDATLIAVDAVDAAELEMALTFRVDRALRGSSPHAEIRLAWTEPPLESPPGVSRSVALPYEKGGQYRLFYTREHEGCFENLKLSTVDGIRASVERSVSVRTAQLGDSDPAARASAALGLGIYGPEAAQAAPRLRELLSDADASMREAARIALEAIEPTAAVTPSPNAPQSAR